MAIHIQILDKSFARELSWLRETSYRATYGEAVDTRYLFWGPNDDRHTNIGLFVNRQLVAAYRIDRVTTAEELEEQLQAPVDSLRPISLPCAALCRAATLPAVQGKGYHHALRMVAMEIAQRQGLDTVVSTTMTGGPPSKLFTDMGYQVFDHPGEWAGFLTPEGRKQIAVLDLKAQRPKAEAVLRDYLSEKQLVVDTRLFDGSKLIIALDPPSRRAAPRDMPALTHRNHFQFGYNGVPFTWRRTPSDTWFVKYGRCERQPMRFDEECRAAARLIRASTTQALHVLFSGGVDSEVTLRSFIEAKISVRAAILRFANDLNVHDISHAVIKCEELGVPYTFYDLDLVDFWRGEAKRYAEASSCLSPQLLSTMWLIDRIPGYPILGSAECLFVKQGEALYEKGVTPYENTQWALWEKERIAAWYRHFMLSGREGCPGFFQYTPEIMLAYLRDPMVQDLLNDKLEGEFSTEGIKAKVYAQYWPLQPRTKYTGFEKVLGYELELQSELSARFSASNHIFATPVEMLSAMLAPAL